MRTLKVLFFLMFLVVVVLGAGVPLLAQNKTLIFPRVAQEKNPLVVPPPVFHEGPWWIGYSNGSWALNPDIRYDITYNNVTEFQMGIALTNAGNSPADVRLTAFGEDGQMLSGPDITNPSTMPWPQGSTIPAGRIPAGMQIARYAWQIFGTGILQKKAWIRADCTGGNVVGFYFIYDNSFNFLSGAAAIPIEKAATRLLLPLLDRRDNCLSQPYCMFPGIFRTGFDVINPGNTPVTVTLNQWFHQGDYYFLNGKVLNLTWTKTLPPKGKIQAEWFWEYLRGYAGSAAGDNYFELIADGPIVASEIVFNNDSEANISSTSSITVVTGLAPSEEGGMCTPIPLGDPPISRPHLTLGFGWNTKIIYVANGGACGGGQKIFDQWGVPLDPPTWTSTGRCASAMIGCKITYELREFLPKSFSGTLNGSMSYRGGSTEPSEKWNLDWIEFTSTDGANFRALVPPIPKTTSAVYPHVAEGSFAPNQFFGTGIAIRDVSLPHWTNGVPDQITNKITLELFSADGKLLQTAWVELCHSCKIAKTLPELFPNMALPQFGGYIKSSGTRTYVSFGMYWVQKNGKLVAVSMIPQL